MTSTAVWPGVSYVLGASYDVVRQEHGASTVVKPGDVLTLPDRSLRLLRRA